MKMRYKKEIIVGLAAVISAAGCSSSDTVAGTTTVNPLGDATIITTNPTKTDAWASMVGKKNVPAFIRGAESGFTVYQRPITLVSAYDQAGEETFSMLANGTDAYGPGDSGCPIVLADGSVVGALFAGDDPQHVFGVSISQEETTGTGPVAKPGSKLSPATSSWAPKQWFFSGPAAAMAFVTKKAAFAQTQFIGGLPGKGSPAKAPGSITAAQLISGVRYAAAILNGPDGQLFVSGAYTFKLPSGQWVATGHAIEGQGPAAWPIYPAYVDFIENDGTVESHITGNAFGTLAFDGQFGSLIDTSKVPTLLPITEYLSLNGVASPIVTHDTVLDRGSNFEEEGVDLGGVLPVIQLIGSSSNLITGSATITVTQGGVSTTTLFPDDGFGTVSTEGPESALVFYSDLETAIDSAWATAYFIDPTTQVEKIVVSVTMTSSPFNP